MGLLRRNGKSTPSANRQDTDSYKASHWVQYPPGVSSMYSYFESRGGRYHSTVRIIFDGFKSPVSLHRAYIELVAGGSGSKPE